MKNRSVVEIIVIMLTLIVALVIVGMSVGLVFIEILNPETDTSILAATLSSLISAILGALFGMMIGKNDKISRRPKDPEEEP